MTNSNTKGAKRERELVNWLDGDGWGVLRAPASGSSTVRELPDVLAGNGSEFYAIELKASAGDPIYYTHEEVAALKFFAEKFGATPLLAARFDEKNGDPSYGEEWPGVYFINPENAYMTSGQNYRIKKETVIAEGVRLPDLGR